jgi:endonuclease G
MQYDAEGTVNNIEQRLRTAVAAMEQRDPNLAKELEDKVRPAATERMEREAEGRRRPRTSEGEARGTDVQPQERRRILIPETIVLRTGRPVLTVKNDQPDLVFKDAESEVWRKRLENAQEQIHRAVLATGRVEVQHHPTFDWIGTGWLIREDIIVTNRHVAQEFARRQGSRFTFRQGTLGRTMRASLDFLEEFGRSEERTFTLKDVLHIEGDDGPDIALLRVAPSSSQKLAEPIALSPHSPVANQQVATIGYPARDSRIPEQDLMEDIFGDVFDKKRLAPGQVVRTAASSLEHDCSTLGGNSGSVVLDLESGEAVGLHFAGRFLVANFAVPANIVNQRLREVTTDKGKSSVCLLDRDSTARPASSTDAQGFRQRLSVTVPVRISIDIGDVSSRATAAAEPPPAEPTSRDVDDSEAEDDSELVLTEARPEDYEDREGFSEAFLGNGLEVTLPTVERNAGDVLEFDFGGETRKLLDYEHFSVMMGRTRKMCIFSAVNIDGTQPRKGKRPGWRSDPRIPETAQLVKGPYGNPPKFSRGHMTRREDPMWGNAQTAARGNADSMHLTNAVPQIQPFNAGIWLGLEEYALQNARQDDMRVCVFTGPVFRRNDPVRFGVKIPVSFWKVIAFIHDDTEELTATGYVMSQKRFLQQEEFVFGAHSTAQTSLAAIENMTGLSFGELSELDPLAGEVEEAAERPLTDFKQIRFV